MAGGQGECYTCVMDRVRLGRIGEDAAAAHLEARGYRIVERNFRCALGEIDLIATQGRVTVFIEVKSRSTADFGRPLEAITRLKQRRLARLAIYYLKGRNLLDGPARFDAVSVALAPDGRVERIELLVDAFGAGS
jgi:putative endonuclease